MKRSASWIQIRKDLYTQVRTQVEKRLGRQRSIESYEADYALEFKKKWRISKPDKLFESLQLSAVILLADFHALYQSQKSHLRILQSLGPHKDRVLGMECFSSKDQKWVDRFMEGKISEKELLKAIEWKSQWGFPWSHYKKLLQWAQKSKVYVLALNKAQAGDGVRALHERDKHAAQVIFDYCKTKPHLQPQIIVIYGDLHIARAHLPLEISKKLGKNVSMTRVFQNSEKVYFQLSKRSLESQVDVVELGKNTFCLNSVPPWVKWQNYLLFLEQNEDIEIEEDELDLSDQVGQYVELMSKELGLGADLNLLSVFTAQESGLWSQLSEKTNPEALKGYKLFIENEVSFFAPQSQVAFLSRKSVNHAATLAMHFLHSQTAQVKSWGFSGADDLERLIWVFGFGYFGSKLVNPKRKSDTIADIKSALVSKGASEYGKESLKLALAQKMNELMFMAHRKRTRLNIQPRQKSSYLVAAELLGGLLGERLYNGYRKGLLSLFTLRNLMQKDWSNEEFPQVYLEAMDMIECLPLAFKSKKDKL